MRAAFKRLLGIAFVALALLGGGPALALSSPGCAAVSSGNFNFATGDDFTTTLDSFAIGDKVSFNIILGGAGSAWRLYANFAANPVLLDSITNNSGSPSTFTFAYTVTGSADTSLTWQLLLSGTGAGSIVTATCAAGPAPTVTSVSPNIVNAAGFGPYVTITGTGFDSTTTVLVTDAAGRQLGNGVAVTIGSQTSITALMPPGPLATIADVRVSTQAGVSTANASDLISFGVASSTSLAASPNPSRFGQPVTFSASVNESSGGFFTFTDNGAPIGTAPINGSGQAALATSSLAVGTHPIAASYPGDFAAGIMASSAALSQVVTKADTSLSITSSAAMSLAGQPVTFTAAVSVAAPGAGTPTGSVEFFDGATLLGSVTFLGVPVTLATSSFGPGRHSITAIFSGDGNFNGVTSSVLAQTVNQAPAITSAAVHSFVVGANGSFTITTTGFPVPTISFGGAKPDGISFLNNGDGTATLSGTTATAGQFALTFTAANGIGSDAQQNFTLNVGKAIATVTASATPAAVEPGQAVTLTANVAVTAPAVATPTGVVTFMKGTTALGTGNLNSGVATLQTTSLSVGRNFITAVYAGDNNVKPGKSPRTIVTVSKGATSTTVRALPMRARAGSAVTLNAHVVAAAPAQIMPTGTVTFKQGAKTLGTGALTAGQANASIGALSIGSHLITAYYGGDSSLTASSATTTVKVSAAVGKESKVNTSTSGSQQQLPAVAALTNGFVVAWASKGQDSSGFGIYAQRYTAAGAKTGAELHISTATVGNQTMPKVAGLTAGGFVVVWQSQNQDTSGYGIYGQRFTAAGAKSGVEFKVNTTTAGAQTLPAVAATVDGGFVVVWTSNGQDGSGRGIYAQRYDSKGKPSGGEFKVNKTTADDQSNPAVAGLTGGGFVVAWQGPDASGLGIHAQRYDAGGNAVGKQLAVNRTTVNDQALPTVAALDTGGFVIAWQSTDVSGLGVSAQRYSEAGAKLGGETLINTTTVNDQGAPSVAGFTDGGYVIAWTSNLQDGSGQGVYAQTYTDDGVRANVEFLVNATAAGDQNQPAAAASASGNFVVVWTLAGDTGGSGIFSQRFRVPIPHLQLSTNARS